MRRSRRSGLASGVLLAAAAFFSSSLVLAAGNEAHIGRDEIHVAVGSGGHAEIVHATEWRVVSGVLRSFDLVGVEPAANLHPEVVVVGPDGSRPTARLAWFAPRVARVTLDDPHGLRKGDYRLEIAYDVDLLATHELVPDGAMWRLAWTAPAATEGLDGQSVTFELPAAPTAPRADMGGANGDEGIVATVERGAALDRLQLVRPHVARGEQVAWAVRLDPRALSTVKLPDVPSAIATTSPAEQRWRLALEGLVVAVAASLYGWTAGRRRGRGLLALSPRLRGIASGAAFGLGLALQAAGSMTAGALALAAAMITATLAPSPRPDAIRGPGAWSAMPPAEAFATPARTSSDRRRLLAALASLLVAAVALVGASVPSISRPLAIAALDLLALLPLLVGGGLAADAFARSRRPLSRAFAALRRRSELTVVPWARTAAGRDLPEELRLRVEPQAPIPGTIGVELGLATTPGAAARPEVLVRVRATSCASARIASLAPWASSVPGLTADERVLRLSPRWPSLRLARKLTERVALALVDRRDEETVGARPSAPGWSGEDRRQIVTSADPSAIATASVVPSCPPMPPPMAKSSAPDASFLLLR